MPFKKVFKVADDFLKGATGSLLGDLLGDDLDYRRSKEAATRQMHFQERMSNTAYQRAMADMRLAGINPIMVSKLGGASTPTGAAFTRSGLSNLGNKAMQARTNAKQFELLDAQAKVAKSQVSLNESASAKNIADMFNKDAQTKKLGMDTALTSMDVVELSKMKLSPMQLKHTVFNQAGSELYKKLKDISREMGKTADDVYDTVYNYVLKEFREQRNYTIPFIVNNPHLLAKEIENKINQGKQWFRDLIRKRGWQ